MNNLVKCYGNHKALKDVSFNVDKGEILGLLGPNGAGKSTTMNIITGYLSSTEGSVEIGGCDILEKPLEAKKKIGYLPEVPPLYTDMTVEEYLIFVGKIKKVSKTTIKDHVNEVMDKVKLMEVKDRLIKNLSKGYKQRVGIAQALIGNPEVLILDEPTEGLDPKQIIEIRNLIKTLGEEHTIILSSHILSEVSAVCERIIIINNGEIVAEGTPEELSKQLNYSSKISLRIKGSFEDGSDILKSLENVESIENIGTVEINTTDITIESKNDMDIREDVFNAFKNSNVPILMMKPDNISLEQIFLEVTKNEREDIKND
ncbi:ATP-binding cassette domain-containing protein [Clostridium sp. KNHs214]|uniref:ABC transporter ATP-binding protein n=1 Tax=Clostridium sp. KNHs214 TaxID=1540257 RepID=UPI00256FE9B5|nr:ATP-binding cassette domain-containing protein [Clostridium sp. KNHs214]